MKKLFTIFLLFAFLSGFSQEVKPIGTNFKTLQSPSFGYNTADSIPWMYKSSLYGWNSLTTIKRLNHSLDSLKRTISGGATPVDDILHWSTNKYTPFSAKKLTDPGYAYFYNSSDMPTYQNLLKLDGLLFSSAFAASSQDGVYSSNFDQYSFTNTFQNGSDTYTSGIYNGINQQIVSHNDVNDYFISGFYWYGPNIKKAIIQSTRDFTTPMPLIIDASDLTIAQGTANKWLSLDSNKKIVYNNAPGGTIDTTHFEHFSNKVTLISGSSTNIQYPSAKLLYDQLALKQNNLGFTPYNNTNPNNYIPLTALSSAATGLLYNNTTGTFSLSSGYSLLYTQPLTTNYLPYWGGDGFYNSSLVDHGAYMTFTKPLNTGIINMTGGLYMNGSTSGQIGVVAPAVAGSATLMLPTTSGTLALVSQIPNSGVTSIAMTTPTGLSITGSPITTSGTLALSLTSGYAIPTTSNILTWNGLITFPGFGASHTTAAYGDHNHEGVYEPVFSKNTAFNKNFGTSTTQVWGYDAHPTTLLGYGISDTPWTGYLPLAGGTLTGALNGTSATFSSSVTANYLVCNSFRKDALIQITTVGGNAYQAVKLLYLVGDSFRKDSEIQFTTENGDEYQSIVAQNVYAQGSVTATSLNGITGLSGSGSATTVSHSDHDHTGTYQPLATVLTNTTASYTTTEQTKLTGIEAGKYIPTLTNTLNITASGLNNAFYSKNGNIIHVMVSGTILPTSPGAFKLTISLPNSKNAAVINTVIGIGTIAENSGTIYGTGLIAYTSSTTVEFRCNATMTATSGNFVLQFDYTM